MSYNIRRCGRGLTCFLFRALKLRITGLAIITMTTIVRSNEGVTVMLILEVMISKSLLIPHCMAMLRKRVQRS